MAEEYENVAGESQTKAQEAIFQEVLKQLCTDAEFAKHVVDVPQTLWGFDLAPNQVIALIEVGHASGKYSFSRGHGFCCCCI
ncbi:MAG: hypothetical protein ACE5EK_01815 [Nitrospinales bacterium]